MMKKYLKFILINLVVITSITALPVLATRDNHSVQQNNVMPDFEHIKSFSQRKQAFCHFIAPIAHKINQQIWNTREKVLALLAKKKLTSKQQHWLKSLDNQYKITTSDIHSQQAMVALTTKLDIIPIPLLIAQAAIESAWGTSRFATKGNNLFGQWCFHPDCGLVPTRRPSNAHYEVERFINVSQSIRAYIYNLNTNPHYQSFRTLRAKLRHQKSTLDSNLLAHGLSDYSQENNDYVAKIEKVIQNNQLNQYQQSHY